MLTHDCTVRLDFDLGIFVSGTVVVSDLNSCNFMGVDSGGEPCRTRSDIHHNPRWNAPELHQDEVQQARDGSPQT